MEPNSTLKLLHSKGNQQKYNLLNGRKYQQIIYLMRLSSRIYKEHGKLNFLKMSKKCLNRHFSIEDIQMTNKPIRNAQYH